MLHQPPGELPDARNTFFSLSRSLRREEAHFKRGMGLWLALPKQRGDAVQDGMAESPDVGCYED